MFQKEIEITVNNQKYRKTVPPRMSLADFLRDVLDLTGTHLGCEHGVCGCCSVLFDGKPIRSCIVLAVQANGHKVTTVEGLGEQNNSRSSEVILSEVQEAFWENHGLQCGYCTPGMLISATSLLKENPNPTELEIREGLSGNICRCTGYAQIVEAVQSASKYVQERQGSQAVDEAGAPTR